MLIFCVDFYYLRSASQPVRTGDSSVNCLRMNKCSLVVDSSSLLVVDQNTRLLANRAYTFLRGCVPCKESNY